MARPSPDPATAVGFGILSRGEVSEWLMVPLSKSGVRKHRGFESRPLRHLETPVGSAGPTWPVLLSRGEVA